MVRYHILFSFILMCVQAQGQKKTTSFVSKDSLYNENIKKSRLYGVYIPRDIDDAMSKLMELTTEEGRQPLKTIDEETMSKKLYFGLGRWMEYNWNFEEGSRISHYLRQKGLTYTEDMTRCMLRLFHRHVLKQPLKTDELIQILVEERKEKIRIEKEKMKIISTEKKIKPKNG